jgi:predicted NAD/FAD-binding protein
MKLAVVGSGISGLAVAHRLRGQADITLFEAGDYFGGHTHTVDLTLNQAGRRVTHGIDTGFLVFNERTYPELIRLFAELGVATARSDMSFSAQVMGPAGQPALEWSGSSLNTVFAQRRNLVRPRFLGMLADVLRFNRMANVLALGNRDAELMQPLADFLRQQGFSSAFRDWYLLPMLGCIWSCPTDQMLEFPLATLIRFCHNHGLIQVSDRPQWWTVAGGARQYVEKITAGILVTSGGQTERFDKLVLASHSDQSLALLAEPSEAERAVLGAIRYQPNRAVLHTDPSVLPRQRRAWAAWNYESADRTDGSGQSVCLHYWINRLQPLPFTQPVLVSLNPLRAIDPSQVHASFDYSHPVFDLAAIRAQSGVAALQGQRHTYFCGAWTGYGFHEDGLKSGLRVAALLQAASVQPQGVLA